MVAIAAAATEGMPASTTAPRPATRLCTSLTAPTVEGMLAEAAEAVAAGADTVELRLDFLRDFDPQRDLPRLLQGCPLPAVVTYRPTWEGGRYEGPEPPRLAALRYAAGQGAAFVDVELKVAPLFFAAGGGVPASTQVIVSSHNYESTPSEQELMDLVEQCHAAGADVVKFATTAVDICDALRVLRVLARCPVPLIALAMGERGLVTRLLAPKYGGFLTFGALSAERLSAPGQPTVIELVGLYRLGQQGPGTKVYGIIGNPVSHSRGPALHNAAMAAVGHDGVYVPLLVDDLPSFLGASGGADWAGFSVTIPHKEAALRCAQEADPLAAAIGAANTLVRLPSQSGGDSAGGLKAYNTDCEAAVLAVERGLAPGYVPGAGAPSPLQGKAVVVVGAGGAGRALAFGAAARGARVVIANRSVQRAQQLAEALGQLAAACSLDKLASGAVRGDVLINTTSVGMHPQEGETVVPGPALRGYQLVFDAVYTPRRTRLLREAEEAGCAVVTGDEMFVGQAAQQFELFTGRPAPVDLMRSVVLKSLGEG